VNPIGHSTPPLSRLVVARTFARAISIAPNLLLMAATNVTVRRQNTFVASIERSESTTDTTAIQTLDGVKFWMAGDLGGDFSHDQADWGVLNFEPSVTEDRRDAIRTILAHLYPVKWNSFAVGRDGTVEWKAGHDRAEARLDGGRIAELALKRMEGMTAEPIVIRNLKYDAAPRNDGFILMPSEVEAYRVGEKAFEFRGTSGFMITIDMTSKDVKR
jgi:hypothetical protein